MSKFKVGDVIRRTGGTNPEWRGKVLLVGIQSMDKQDIVVEVLSHNNPAYVGVATFGFSQRYELAPKTHKVTLVTYSPFHDSDKVTSYADKDFTTPEAWKKEWPLHALRDYRLIEIELKE